jgi:seryl-tRNA synthetase
MHDLTALRQNPEYFDAQMARRGLPPQAAQILVMDAKCRLTQTQLQELQAKRNQLSQQIGGIKKAGGDATTIMAEVAALKDQMTALEHRLFEEGGQLSEVLDLLPNLPVADVPDGRDESGNVEVKCFGNPVPKPAPHYDIKNIASLMDFDTAANLSGARFTLLRGALAQLERALGNFMLDIHTREFGYEEISPPLMVRTQTMFGTAQLPKFIDDQFRIEGRDLWLIPTAEVPLTNIVADQILDPAQLPLRFTARTPCFRAEAGAAGRDTRGMIRQHQFYKIELVSITTPEQSEAEHERMTRCAETVLERLELPYRRMLLCAGDMGFPAQKTYDLEVWMAGAQTYREISSCSNCGAFQARRMKARMRDAGEKSTQFVHTLNGSGLAVGRCLAAILENYQDVEKGGVVIPAILRPYMNGEERIG